MKNIFLSIISILFIFNSVTSSACSMYKITKDGKTMVGNNEDWLSPNSQFWFEVGQGQKYGVMYMGQLDNFAQGAINEKGLIFDGFANPELAIENSEGKLNIPMAEAIRNIMQSMSHVEEVKEYLETINLSSLTSSQIVFVDPSGTYLIVEGDELIIGKDQEKAFSNFYYSQIGTVEDVEIETFQNGMKYLKSTEAKASLDYGGKVMESLSNTALFGTQYSTVYDLNALTIRVYLFHDYSQFIEFDLKKELSKENYSVMIADLFPEESIGYQHYDKYNDEEHPERFLKDLESEEISEKELQEMDFNTIINMIGYEWLNEKDNAKAAIKIFEYGISLMPSDADLYDSLGKAYFNDKNYPLSKMNYKKSLALKPENKNAAEFIAKIDLIKDK